MLNRNPKKAMSLIALVVTLFSLVSCAPDDSISSIDLPSGASGDIYSIEREEESPNRVVVDVYAFMGEDDQYAWLSLSPETMRDDMVVMYETALNNINAKGWDSSHVYLSTLIGTPGGAIYDCEHDILYTCSETLVVSEYEIFKFGFSIIEGEFKGASLSGFREVEDLTALTDVQLAANNITKTVFGSED